MDKPVDDEASFKWRPKFRSSDPKSCSSRTVIVFGIIEERHLDVNIEAT